MELEPILTDQEKLHIKKIKYRWNDLRFLQEYINEKKLEVNPTSLMEAWRILFPSLYPLIVEERNKLTFTALTHLLEYKNTDYYFPRSSGYKTLYDFSAVIRKIKFYGAQVDVFYDVFDIDKMYEEEIRRKQEKKELYRIYIKKKLDKDMYLLIDEFI